MMTMISTKANDFDFGYDYYFVEIVCDDDDEVCGGDGDDGVCEIFSFSSSSYV